MVVLMEIYSIKLYKNIYTNKQNKNKNNGPVLYYMNVHAKYYTRVLWQEKTAC